MKEILNLSLKLGLICALAGAALAAVNAMTDQPRRQAAETVRQNKLKLVLPAEAAAISAGEEIAGVTFFTARDGHGKVLAFAAEGSSRQGFGGEIKVLAGLHPDGSLRAVLVSSHAETPGIGTQVTERKAVASLWALLRGKNQSNPFPPNRFLDAFRDRQPGALTLNTPAPQGIDAISGATVSSRAVLDAVNQIGRAWQEKQNHAARSVDDHVQP